MILMFPSPPGVNYSGGLCNHTECRWHFYRILFRQNCWMEVKQGQKFVPGTAPAAAVLQNTHF